MLQQAKKYAALTLLIVGLVAGCNSSGQYNNNIDYAALNKQLKLSLARQKNEIIQLNRQLATLRGFPADRLKYIVAVTHIAFGRFTQPYDKNHDGRIDSINIYLLPTDKDGDIIKAAGKVEINLWDLTAPRGKRFLGYWVYNLKDLQKHWLSGFMANHYKFALPWPESKQFPAAGVTVNLTYKDALTGNSFEIQKLLLAE